MLQQAAVRPARVLVSAAGLPARRALCSAAEAAAEEDQEPKQNWVPRFALRSYKYTAQPTVEQARSRWIKLTPFETQFTFNRRVYNEQVSALRRQYMEEHHKNTREQRVKVLKHADKKISKHEALMAERWRLVNKDRLVLDENLVQDSGLKEEGLNKARSTRRRQATLARKMDTEHFQQRLLLLEREKHWIEDPENIAEDVFADTQTTTLKGFWPVPTPEHPTGFAGGRVNAHIHYTHLPKMELADGDVAMAASLWKQHSKAKRGEPMHRFYNPVQAEDAYDSELVGSRDQPRFGEPKSPEEVAEEQAAREEMEEAQRRREEVVLDF